MAARLLGQGAAKHAGQIFHFEQKDRDRLGVLLNESGYPGLGLISYGIAARAFNASIQTMGTGSEHLHCTWHTDSTLGSSHARGFTFEQEADVGLGPVVVCGNMALRETRSDAPSGPRGRKVHHLSMPYGSGRVLPYFRQATNPTLVSHFLRGGCAYVRRSATRDF